jgi:RNA polymerase sigma-70 factor (ECF subfamily)
VEVRPWVYAILHNLLVDHQRQRSRRGTAVPLHLVDDAALGRPADQDTGLHHRDLLRALDALPEEPRTVLLLVSVEGLPYAEVAAVVGVPLGTVMSRISRGRDRLATLLREGERPRLRSVQ